MQISFQCSCCILTCENIFWNVQFDQMSTFQYTCLQHLSFSREHTFLENPEVKLLENIMKQMLKPS